MNKVIGAAEATMKHLSTRYFAFAFIPFDEINNNSSHLQMQVLIEN
ncbi:hypothetical protein JCM19233_3809 [Vibrio astriarenae]|nr:hypothetical protein JCM19233_3809 [Vibrio sp. C7]